MVQLTKLSIKSGTKLHDLGNQIAGIIPHAVDAGLPLDAVVCVIVSVCADYARIQFGPEYLAALALVVTKRAEFPLPETLPGTTIQ